MPVLSIRHVTRYRYRNPVALGEHRMMFRPRESYDQRILSSDLKITPKPDKLRSIHDVFGNCVSIAQFSCTSRELTFESRVKLEHAPLPAFADMDGKVEIYTGSMPFAYGVDDLADLHMSMRRQHADPEGRIDRWARQFVEPGETSLQALLSNITNAIRATFKYNVRHAKGAQTPLETLALGTGSCRDYAVFMIDAVRSLGLAARFVSGYICTPRKPGSPPRRGGGHTHAWVHVYLPAFGWVEFDPTNGIVGNSDLVRVAIARDPRQAVPLHGTWTGAPSDYLGMDVEVDVREEPH
ncbi:MAG: transglutaminase family protein [Hyphomonadaceae bacterium]|nr:transglutaminase family protein [Hyphomonadaceae bacterium]